jgi:hypothetical protein
VLVHGVVLLSLLSDIFIKLNWFNGSDRRQNIISSSNPSPASYHDTHKPSSGFTSSFIFARTSVLHQRPEIFMAREKLRALLFSNQSDLAYGR